MTDADKVTAFINGAGWGESLRHDFPADFSSRHYARLRSEKDPSRSAILMISPAEQKPESFVSIAKALRQMEISAPEIYAADTDQGLVLMEDLGDDNFGVAMDRGADEFPLFQRGLGVLLRLHQVCDLSYVCGVELPIYDEALFADQVLWFLDFYWLHVKETRADEETRESFRSLWMDLLKEAVAGPQTLMLRDYIPDNLMSLKGRGEWRDTGVLDFQDAGVGPEIYDLVSLAECVRRDIGDGTLDRLVSAYAFGRRIKDIETLRRAAVVFSAQRHMRTLGNVVRRPEKQKFAAYIEPHLRHLLTQEEILKPLLDWCIDRKVLP
jgi:aminoglycoside/choline kinase family phosphotransferase